MLSFCDKSWLHFSSLTCHPSQRSTHFCPDGLITLTEIDIKTVQTSVKPTLKRRSPQAEIHLLSTVVYYNFISYSTRDNQASYIIIDRMHLRMHEYFNVNIDRMSN